VGDRGGSGDEGRTEQGRDKPRLRQPAGSSLRIWLRKSCQSIKGKCVFIAAFLSLRCSLQPPPPSCPRRGAPHSRRAAPAAGVSEPARSRSSRSPDNPPRRAAPVLHPPHQGCKGLCPPKSRPGPPPAGLCEDEGPGELDAALEEARRAWGGSEHPRLVLVVQKPLVCLSQVTLASLMTLVSQVTLVSRVTLVSSSAKGTHSGLQGWQ